MGMAKNTRERGREQAGMTREGRRTMEKVLENTVRDIGAVSIVWSLIQSVMPCDVLDCVDNKLAELKLPHLATVKSQIYSYLSKLTYY